MVEEIIKEVGAFGLGGLVLAYFLYQDSQDRKAFRDEIRGNREKLQDHETRISILETESK